MIYAQIKDGTVRNVILLDDLSISHLFSDGFDYFIDVTAMSPRPEIGWSYVDETFSRVETVGPDPLVGTASLVNGQVTVLNTNVVEGGRISLTSQEVIGPSGDLSVDNIVTGVSFDIISTESNENSIIAYQIIV